MMFAEAAAASGEIGCVVSQERGGDGREAEKRHQQECQGSTHVDIVHRLWIIFQKFV
jgi:hypothetical protein